VAQSVKAQTSHGLPTFLREQPADRRLGGDRRAQAAWKRSRESYKDTLDLFLTLVYLKNKKPKKKKKKKTLFTK
jgi:hypothetical protein